MYGGHRMELLVIVREQWQSVSPSFSEIALTLFIEMLNCPHIPPTLRLWIFSCVDIWRQRCKLSLQPTYTKSEEESPSNDDKNLCQPVPTIHAGSDCFDDGGFLIGVLFRAGTPSSSFIWAKAAPAKFFNQVTDVKNKSLFDENLNKYQHPSPHLD